MDIEEARNYLRVNHRAILVTRRKGGRLQQSPIAVAIDGDGRAIVSSRETAYKTRNLRRDPRASLCVFSDTWFGPWVQIDGAAEIVSLPDAMELLEDYYRRLRGDHPDWDEYRQAMEKEKRVMIRVTIENAGPNRSG